MAIVTLAVASVCAYKLGKHYKEKHDEKKHHKRSHSYNPSTSSSTYNHKNRSVSDLDCDCYDDSKGEYFYYDDGKKSKSKSSSSKHKRSHSTSRLPHSSSTSKLPLVTFDPVKAHGTHLAVPGQPTSYFPPATPGRVGLASEYYNTHPQNFTPPPPPSVVYAPSYASGYVSPAPAYSMR